MMTSKDCSNLAALEGQCSYHDANKAEFKRLAMKLLRELAKTLGLEKSTYVIRYNAFGIACSGDATLHADNVYVSMNADMVGLGIMVRTCHGRRDFTGGHNNWHSYQRLAADGIERLAGTVRWVMQGEPK